jgi:hypothetical protein
MANSDPIATIVQAISILVAPSPALNTANPQASTIWTDGSNVATDGTLYAPVQALLGVLFGASDDLTSVGKSVNTGLVEVADVIATIAKEFSILASVKAEATSAFSALQTILTLAQTIAPSSATGVLQSAGRLFQQMQSLISALSSIELAAAELGELSQQLKAAAPLFPPA